MDWGATRKQASKQASKLVWFCGACTTASLHRRGSPIYALRLCRHYTISKLSAPGPYNSIYHLRYNIIRISQVPTRTKFAVTNVHIWVHTIHFVFSRLLHARSFVRAVKQRSPSVLNDIIHIFRETRRDCGV